MHDSHALSFLDPSREPRGDAIPLAVVVAGGCGGVGAEDLGRHGFEAVEFASTVEVRAEGRVAEAPPAPQLLVAADDEEPAADELQASCLGGFEIYFQRGELGEFGQGKYSGQINIRDIIWSRISSGNVSSWGCMIPSGRASCWVSSRPGTMAVRI